MQENKDSFSYTVQSTEASLGGLIERFTQEDDLPYEADLSRAPGRVHGWLRYAEAKKAKGDRQGVYFVFERALKEMPGSYKLWKAYLDNRLTDLMQAASPTPDDIAQMNGVFERALIYMHQMPRIWLDYTGFLSKQRLITVTRHVFDRALKSLPVTLHTRIWDACIRFADAIEQRAPLTALHLRRRYLQLAPMNADEFIEVLVRLGCFDEAAQRLADMAVKCLADKMPADAAAHWKSLCSLLVKHAESVKAFPSVDAVFRAAVEAFPSEQGSYWCALATFHIKRADFDRARDCFEAALDAVRSARDFTLVFDSYAKLEETLLNLQLGESDAHATSDEESDGSSGKDVATASKDKVNSRLELQMAKFEYLLGSRAWRMAEALIRQAPNNPTRWLERVVLETDDAARIALFERAIRTIKPAKVTEQTLPKLWSSFARVYSENGDLESARAVMEEAVKQPFQTVDELAVTWIAYAEIDPEHALDILARATKPPGKHIAAGIAGELHKSVRLWSYYVDREEARGLLEPVRAVYEQMLAFRVCTPQHVVNYAVFLEHNGLFDESFRAYERGIELFGWPVAFEFWNVYLPKFIAAAPLKGTRMERARELFEQAVKGCPEKHIAAIYIMYATMEEQHGLVRNAMSIYERACAAITSSPEDRLAMYSLYVDKARAHLGIIATRDIYVAAIRTLPDTEAREMCLRLTSLETQLGEFERARAVFGHASQFSDPRTAPSLWDAWQRFEVEHGSEENFRDMLRVKRAVQAKFAAHVLFVPATQALPAEVVAPNPAFLLPVEKNLEELSMDI